MKKMKKNKEEEEASSYFIYHKRSKLLLISEKIPEPRKLLKTCIIGNYLFQIFSPCIKSI